MIRVSCLMPTYGRLARVCDAIACYVGQSFPAEERELVILNSHPIPLTIAPDLAAEQNIIVYNDPSHFWWGPQRNALVGYARGEFIRSWEDNSLYLPWAIEQAMTHIGDAEGFKPKFSWYLNPADRVARLDENQFEASQTWRKDAVLRAGGFGPEVGAEHLQFISKLRIRVMDCVSSYVYSWGDGMWHISGTHGHPMGGKARVELWRAHNQDSGDGLLRPTPDSVARRIGQIWEFAPNDPHAMALRQSLEVAHA